jgi:(p)ppGpp synthase/HD superfamily hydrolase
VDDPPQTNLQLFNALRAAGYDDGDVARIKAAHDFVSPLFAGWFRASGKPFIAHLIGTAGTLAALRARPPVVAAGLGHAIYTQGELPAATARSPRLMRARVRRALGDEAEDLIARYSALEWSAPALPGLRDRLGALGAADREVVLIRLANELDDHLDLAALYCANADARRRQIDSGLRLSVVIAEELGCSELAARLERAFDLTLGASVPDALRTSRAASFAVRPVPMWRRRAAWLRRIAAGAARRAGLFSRGH